MEPWPDKKASRQKGLQTKGPKTQTKMPQQKGQKSRQKGQNNFN